MEILQSLIQGYLESADYNLLDVREGFLVADRLQLGGYRDTRLLWIPPPSTRIDDFRQLEHRFLREFEKVIPQYQDARCFIVAHTLEGFSKEFRSEAARLRVSMSVPILFLDAPFKIEEAPQTSSVMKTLKETELGNKRVPQPYTIVINGEPKEEGDDLFPDLLDELIGTEFSLSRPKNPCLRIVVGAAGAGKSVLFQALFARAYEHFHEHKRKRQISTRPIPFIPEYLRQASGLRTEALIDSLLRTEVAVPVPRCTFEWMLIHGFSMWLLDGLDELYAGDPDFFQYLLELLTRPESQAQILICARNSLLTTSETFARFLEEFPPGSKDAIRVYRLNDWEYPSKRIFAWINLEGHLPGKNEPDSPHVTQFLTTITQSVPLKSLSGLPYYCDLLLGEFKQGTLVEFQDDFSLIDRAVSGIIQREIKKGLLVNEQFEPEGLDNWLETVALEYYMDDFKGLSKAELEEYAQIILREELSFEERRNAITTLIQFPLFTPGIREGIITFKHELVAEYLAGRLMLKRLVKDPTWVARSLNKRIDLADSLILRYMASRVVGLEGGFQTAIETLKSEPLSGRAFVNLLQLLLLSTPLRDVIRGNKIELEGRDLRYVQFRDKDLQGVSFRNCDLSNATFKTCDLQNAMFECTVLSGTKFEQLSEEALRGARFGKLERFEFIYVGRQTIDDFRKMVDWLQSKSSLSEKVTEPCPATLQLRAIFLKFVYPDGTGRRDDLPENALIKGKQYPKAPSPEDCVRACIRFGFLQSPDFRKRIKRTPGERYDHVVFFIRDWRLTPEMRQLLNSLCKKSGCEHIFESTRC
jgi:hypothetical protein